VISVEPCNCSGKDGLDLLSRDLVLKEVTRIHERGKHISEVLLASVPPEEAVAGISNDREQPRGHRSSAPKLPDRTSRRPQGLLNGIFRILRSPAVAKPVSKDDLSMSC
jgi:hypothetical protein